MLGKIPLEPKILQSTEKGKCIVDEFPDSQATKIYKSIIECNF